MQLTADQIDALQELVNIGVGRAANMLNEMLETRILLQVPFIKILSPLDLKQELEGRFSEDYLAAVRLGFSGIIFRTFYRWRGLKLLQQKTARAA